LTGLVALLFFVMADKNNLYVEKNDDGQYAVKKPHAQRASDILPTQKEAIERAKEINPNAAIHVERVRDTDKGSRDKWRHLS
jgi:uncharacterized protein YdaT